LGAKFVVEGRVRKAGNRIRITAQLIDADTENHIWAETYDRELKDIFAIQDEIAHQIVAALNIEYRTAERTRAMRIPTENLTAYDSVLRGLSHVLRFTKEENAKARELFERAMGLDPEYALAYMGLGMTYYWDYALGWNTDPGTLERAYESGRTAVSLDDSVSFSHILLTWVYRARGQYEQAILQAQRAVFLNPNDADAYLQMGSILNSVGRSEEALEHIKKAMHLNPHYTFEYMVELAAVYEALGRYEEAIESRKEALVRNPNFPGLYWRLAWSYLGLWGTQQNDDPEILGKALKMAQESVALNGNTSWNHMALSVIFLTRKQHEQAVLEAEKAIAIDPEAGLHGILAHVYNSMGRSEDSIALAEKALERNPEDTGALGVLGHAYRLTGRLEEAAAVAAQQVTSRLDFRLSYERHIELTVLYAELGRIEKAKKEAAEILKLVPHFSVEVWGQRAFYTDQAQTDRDMTALRKAGLK